MSKEYARYSFARFGDKFDTRLPESTKIKLMILAELSEKPMSHIGRHILEGGIERRFAKATKAHPKRVNQLLKQITK